MTRTIARDAGGACLASIPSWEDPIHRFFYRGGELQFRIVQTDEANSLRGPLFTLYDLLDAPAELFPIRIGGTVWTREDLEIQATVFKEIEPPS